MRFEKRVAVVTAGGSGMGQAICRRLAAEGASVLVVDIDGAAAKGTAEGIVADGGRAEARTVDVTDTAHLRELLDHVERTHGVLHVLHNQVGVPGAAGMEIEEDEWQRVLDINLKSAFYASRYALPLLKQADGRASVTFTASTSALVGSPYSPLYSVTKTALIGLVRSLALHVAKDGIRVNAICPGPVETPMFDTFFSRGAPEELEERKRTFLATVPLGRASNPEEIAGVIAFLASDEAAFITGVALPVDGGITAA